MRFALAAFGGLVLGLILGVIVARSADPRCKKAGEDAAADAHICDIRLEEAHRQEERCKSDLRDAEDRLEERDR